MSSITVPFPSCFLVTRNAAWVIYFRQPFHVLNRSLYIHLSLKETILTLGSASSQYSVPAALHGTDQTGYFGPAMPQQGPDFVRAFMSTSSPLSILRTLTDPHSHLWQFHNSRQPLNLHLHCSRRQLVHSSVEQQQCNPHRLAGLHERQSVPAELERNGRRGVQYCWSHV